MKKKHQWGVFVVLPVIILFAAALLKWESISYFSLRRAARFYAGRANMALDIGRVAGNIFSETTLENISLGPEKGQSQTYHFTAQAITCSYNLWDLSDGLGIFLQGLHCSAQTPDLTYDFMLDTPQEQPENKPHQLSVPAFLPGIDLHNGTVILTHAGDVTEIRGIFASLQGAADDAHELQLQVENFKFKQDGETKIDTGFTSLLRYSDAKIIIDSFEMGEKEISAAGFVDLVQIDKGITGFAGDLALADNRLNIAGSKEDKLLKMHAGTDSFDIGELQKRLGGSGWNINGKIRGEVDFVYNLEAPKEGKGSFAFDVQDGQVHEVEIESLSVAGSFGNDVFNISIAEARSPGNHILFKDVSVPMPLLFKGDVVSILGGSRAIFTADISDFATLLQLIKVEKNVFPAVVRPDSLTINGYLEKGIINLEKGHAVSADTSLTIDRAKIPIQAPREALDPVTLDIAARIQSSNLQGLAGLMGDIPVNGQAAANISVAGSIKEPRAVINLTGEDLTFREKQLGSIELHGDVYLSQEKPGVINSIKFEVTEMTQENRTGILGLLSPVTGAWKDDMFAMNGVFQLDNKGEVSAGISRIPGKGITVEITMRGLDSDGWLESFIDNRYFFHGADIEAVLKGLPDATQLMLSGTISEAGGTGVGFPLGGSFTLNYSPEGIEITEFTWKSLERNQLSITGFLPYDPMAQEPFLDGDMSLKGHVDFPALEDIAFLLEPWGIGTGSVVLDMDLNGSWNQPEGSIHFQAEGINPPGSMTQYMDSAVDFSGDIAARGGAIVLQTANLESKAYSVKATGSWRHTISIKELLQKRHAELKGEITADAQLKFKDLNFLRHKFPWLRRFEGDMQGEIHLSGPITTPSLKGSFSLKDGEASHIFNLPMLSAVNLQGDFDEHSITLKTMQAEVGGSPVNFTGRIYRGKEAVDISLHVDGKNVLLFRNNDMRMRGDVNLDISGPLERLAVKGTTGLTGGYYTGNIDFLSKVGSSSAPVSEGRGFLFSFPDPPLKNAVFDIRITTIEPFRIRNNLIRGVLRPELSLKGTGELPFLVGSVYIDPSRVILPSGRLQVKSGLLSFLEGKPDRPQLDLLAHSKVLDYDINVVTRGPLDDPVISLSSSPALPNDDLLLLLLTGQPPKQDIAGGAKSSGTTNVMVYLGRDFLSKWLEDESSASDESIFDRFELNYGRGVTKSGEQTVEGTFQLSELKTGERKVYYLSAEKDKYDAYNYGLKLVFRFD